MTTSDPVPVTPPDNTQLVEARAAGNPIARAIVAAAVAGLTAAITALNDGGNITATEWVAIVIAVLVTGGAVWAIPTVSTGVKAWGKAITAAVVSALGVLGTGLADGRLTQAETLMVITALLSGLLVSTTPEVVRRAQATSVPPPPAVK